MLKKQLELMHVQETACARAIKHALTYKGHNPWHAMYNQFV